MPSEVSATVTGTASTTPPPPKLRKAFDAALAQVVAAAGRIRFDGEAIAVGGRHNVHEVARLYRRVPLIGLKQTLFLGVSAPAGLAAPEAARLIQARIASLNQAVIATRALSPDQYKVVPADAISP